MPNSTIISESESPKFLLTLQLLTDEFVGNFPHVRKFCKNDSPKLDNLCLYQEGELLSPSTLYVLKADDITESLRQQKDVTLLIAGEIDYFSFSEGISILQVGEQKDFIHIFNIAQKTFSKYAVWERKLLLALSMDNPIDEMLRASLPIFHNPIFAHDLNFYILSCPHSAPKMSVWEKDSRTGRLMVPLDLIHDFKIDVEYLTTLTTRGVHIYSEEMRGYRILYRNIWIDDNYEGRLCVNELESSILPGQFLVLDYLGTYIEMCIRHLNLFQLNMRNDMRQFLSDLLDGSSINHQEMQYYLSFLNWNQNDRYLCLYLITEQQDAHMHSSVATLGHIETQIPSGFAFVYKQGIAVVANLSYDHSKANDVVSNLAIIMREGLFKMGVSSEITDFTLLSQGFIQANFALNYGQKSGSMIWCHRFDDYTLEYILTECSLRIHPQLLCSDALLTLRKYDEKNKTELYHTLKVYLELERNALQAANKLYIHRSSLFYRLERIHKLTNVNLDDPKERIILLLSIQLLEQQGIKNI